MVARIPKATCLSARTTSIAPLLAEEELGGGLALTVAVMVERALGRTSKWHTCVADREPRGGGSGVNIARRTLNLRARTCFGGWVPPR